MKKITPPLFHWILSVALMVFATTATAEVFPRVGFNVGNYYLEDYNSFDAADEIVAGPTFGALFLFNDSFIDLSAESYQFSTEFGADIDRTEIAGTYGFRLRETMYGLIGYQNAFYGDGIMDDETGESYGPFVGISINNLRMGQDSKNVFSLALAVLAQTTDYANESSDDVSTNIKIGYRRANTPHGFAVKYQNFGSDLQAEWITMFNYSYQFGAL